MRPEDFNSPHFLLCEFTYSHYATRNGIDNTPPPEAVDNLQRLCTLVLEPLRADLARFTQLELPVNVTSGYRSHDVNRGVGGAYHSAHRFGRAADIVTLSREYTRTLLAVALARIGELPIDQLIAEHTDEHGIPQWIHVSYSSEPRHIFLKG